MSTMDPENDPDLELSGGGSDDEDKKTNAKAGRRKIKIELIQDKSRRHITFSKRKLGIMKKAWELATLTGTQVLLLVASETGHVYTFATPKLQPLITKPEGKNLIQSCLNAPDPLQAQPVGARARYEGEFEDPNKSGQYRGTQQAPYSPSYNNTYNKPGYFPPGGSGAPSTEEQGE